MIGLKKMSLALGLILLALQGCASQMRGPSSSEFKTTYLNDVKSASINIIYERGHNSHRFFLVNESKSPQVFVFHDRQLFKSLSIKESKFKELLTRSVEAADLLERMPTKKSLSPCRTPFAMTLKNTAAAHTVEGCRASEEGVVIGKLIAEIEFMLSSDTP